MRKIIGLGLVVLLLSACSWVKLTPEGEKVTVAKAAHVANCKFAGTTMVSVKSDVVSVDRDIKTIKTELETLARNEASKLKGDTIVPVTEVKDGEQSFKVYQCNP
ncbi:MAG: DUF4156 domain-containing protein [Halobacteria archaeon]|nr:DUF4156 domain-containing protein [Halobacteria archaeon]